MCAHCAAVGGVFGIRMKRRFNLHIGCLPFVVWADIGADIGPISDIFFEGRYWGRCRPAVTFVQIEIVSKRVQKRQVRNDRFKAIRTATMGDVEIAYEGVPRSAYELQALAIHAKDQALVADEVVPRSAYELQA